MSDDDKTPPEITTGSFVSWSGGKGRVDLIVRKGKVPGVEGDVEATDDAPAARVVVWKDDKPTREKIAASTHTLKRIAPLDGGGEKSGIGALISMATDHAMAIEATGAPAYTALSGKSIKDAYDRGVQEWPGEEKTILSAEEWGLGRAAHLCKTAVVTEVEGNDADLLDPEHPKYVAPAAVEPVEPEPVETVEIDASEIEATLAAIDADVAPEN